LGVNKINDLHQGASHYENRKAQVNKLFIFSKRCCLPYSMIRILKRPQIGSASLRNCIELGKLWLNLDLSSYSLYLMPIGFLPSPEAVVGIAVSNDERNLVNYLAGLMKDSMLLSELFGVVFQRYLA
jgi:hypothetical protein